MGDETVSNCHGQHRSPLSFQRSFPNATDRPRRLASLRALFVRITLRVISPVEQVYNYPAQFSGQYSTD